MDSELVFYKKVLFDDILPFWEKYAPDEEYGGFFTCFTNNGEKMLSEDKYIWSQGRVLWCLSVLAARPEIDGERREKIALWAEKTADFPKKHARMENGNCVFLTERDGQHKTSGGFYDSSIYADCFVIIGMSEYAKYSLKKDVLDFAYDLYLHSKKRYNSGDYRTDPYPEPRGYRTHGLTMIFTNTARTLADAMADAGHPDAEAVSLDAYGFAKDVIDTFVDKDGILHETVKRNGEFDTDNLIGRYINPGHTIEDCWFMYTEWERFSDLERLKKTERVLENALRIGWDGEYGGICLFRDFEGGEPKGEIPNPDEPMVKKATADTHCKLWWVHSEALYSTLLFSYNSDIKPYYERIKGYTFSTFPNRENDRGEWIQIRDREGKPEQRVVALPVKDPFHIIRNLLLIIQLLEK